MPKIAPNMVQNKINNMYSSYKPCNNEEHINDDDHRTKGMSFLALVFFVFFYVCISYVFNISVCDVLNDGRLLFFLSNTLVMILVADFGAFASSSSKVVNVYESYGKVPIATYVEVDDTKEERVTDAPPVPARLEVVKLLTYHDDSCDDIGTDDDDDDDEEGMEETIEEVEQVVEKTEEEEDHKIEDDEQVVEKTEEEEEDNIEEDEQVVEKTEEEEDDDGKIEEDGQVMEKTEEDEEDDKYSQMSDEELNKRVEEFIWRLKKQIRLQAGRDTD